MEIYARIVGILRIIKGIGSVAGATRAILPALLPRRD